MEQTIEGLLEACKAALSFFERAPIHEMEAVEKALGELAPMQELSEAIIAGVETAQKKALDPECASVIEGRAVQLLEAAPDLYVASTEALEWFSKARLGTLEQLEEALGEEAPVEALSQAVHKARGTRM